MTNTRAASFLLRGYPFTRARATRSRAPFRSPLPRHRSLPRFARKDASARKIARILGYRPDATEVASARHRRVSMGVSTRDVQGDSRRFAVTRPTHSRLRRDGERDARVRARTPSIARVGVTRVDGYRWHASYSGRGATSKIRSDLAARLKVK